MTQSSRNIPSLHNPTLVSPLSISSLSSSFHRHSVIIISKRFGINNLSNDAKSILHRHHASRVIFQEQAKGPALRRSLQLSEVGRLFIVYHHNPAIR